LDHISGSGAGSRSDVHPASVDGAGALRWWAKNDVLSGNFDKAPRREPDQFIRVMIAGWVDGGGDYHAPSEIYAVMRRGSWWAAPPASPLVSASGSTPTPAPLATTPISTPAPTPNLPSSSTSDESSGAPSLPDQAAMRVAPKAAMDPVATAAPRPSAKASPPAAPQPGKL
jgi:hypothetical protein